MPSSCRLRSMALASVLMPISNSNSSSTPRFGGNSPVSAMLICRYPHCVFPQSHPTTCKVLRNARSMGVLASSKCRSLVEGNFLVCSSATMGRKICLRVALLQTFNAAISETAREYCRRVSRTVAYLSSMGMLRWILRSMMVRCWLPKSCS